MSARDIAIETIKQEHRALAVVVGVLQRLLGAVAAHHVDADFVLFSAALCYLDDFPERCHHPKEDEVLFKALRRHTDAFNKLLDELQAEHVRSAHLMGQLHHALVHYQGGAPGGFKLFRAAVDAYAAMLSEHMRKEEQLLARIDDHLTEVDWSWIAAAFEANDDPLFGSNRSEEFHRLHARIVNLLPRKIKYFTQHNPREG